MKPQIVRLADVFVIGPIMIVSAHELHAKRPALAMMLGAFGAATVLYNLRNYLTIENGLVDEQDRAS